MSKIAGFFHDCYHGAAFWLEGEWQHLKRYWPEMKLWLLFLACLAALTFVLGISVGFIVGK